MSNTPPAKETVPSPNATRKGGGIPPHEGATTAPLRILLARHPELAPAAAGLLAAFEAIVAVLEQGEPRNR